MKPGNCPTCGTPLGAGALDGLCPRCLVADGSCAVTTEDASAMVHEIHPARVGAAETDAIGAGDAPPSADVARRRLPGQVDAAPAGSEGGKHNPEDDHPPVWCDRAPAPRIEGYDVLRELKHGGQGIVYLAVQRSTKRKVAVKVLLEGMFASKSARRRFEREIELVASLKHPNIIAVFDSGCTPDGHEFYVMDYVRGVPVTQYVCDKALGLEQVLALFATTCEAVNHAHLRGVIHRDLKPSNILVDVEGNLRVLDFGLAKALIEPAESIVSVTGNVVGTFPYMSPEQTRANPDEMDTRTDVYALGVILYEALTGKHPYPVTGNVADIVRHIVQTPPAPPSKCWTGESGVRAGEGRRRRRRGRCPIDSDLETILLKALSKERERRYDNAGHFARDLRRYLADEAIVARRPSAWYHLRMFSRRHRALTSAMVSVVVVLMAAVVVTTWQLKLLQAANLRASQATEAIVNFMAFGGDDQADRGDYIAARRLYTQALDEASSHRMPGSSILAGLVEIGSGDGAIPLLGTYGAKTGAGGFLGHHRHPTNVAILHRRRQALTGTDDGMLLLWDLDTGRLVRQVTAGSNIGYVAVSADERWAVTAGADHVVKKWDLDTLAPGAVIMWHDGEFWMAAISPDGRRVIAGTGTGHLLVWDGPGLVPRDFGHCAHAMAALAFLPGDSNYALAADGDTDHARGDDGGNHIQLWDLNAGRPLWTNPLTHGGQHLNCFAFSPDGRKVVTASFDATVMIWDVHGTGANLTLTNKTGPIEVSARTWRAAFSPDSRTLAVACEDGRVALIDVNSQTKVRTLRAQTGGVMGVEFLDDHTLVSTGDNERDDKDQCVNSALMLWEVGEAGDAHVAAAIRKLAVDNAGHATVETTSGTKDFYIGEDGGLHDKWTTGPAAPPWEPKPPADGTKSPSWAQGGRSRAAPATGGPAATELVSLEGGKVKLYGGAGGTLQLWASPRAGPGHDGGPAVLMRTFQGHKAAVTAAAVSPNGRYIVSADTTGTIKAWDLLRPLRGRELEKQMTSRSERMSKSQIDPDPAVLREWYAFRGRGE